MEEATQTNTTCAWETTQLSVERVSVANLPTEYGEFKIAGYRARESLMHMLYETNLWLDKYVKNAKP